MKRYRVLNACNARFLNLSFAVEDPRHPGEPLAEPRTNNRVAPPIGANALNYNADLLTQLQFVGPNSDHPSLSAIPHDYNNVGPAVGFAWQVPWFGAGKTSVRGGYQVTFQAGQNAGTIEGAISNPPGSTVSQTYSPSSGDPDPYLDLTKLGKTAPVPLIVPFRPVQAPPVYTHGGSAFGANSYTAFDPKFSSPYVQNLTLTVQRNITRQISAEVRYVGTLSVKQIRTVNLNTNNSLRNPLFQELDSRNVQLEQGNDARQFPFRPARPQRAYASGGRPAA
jgi:hypothetical protein